MLSKTVSYSEIETYRQCRLKHQLAYAEGWRPPLGQEAEALGRGTLFHSIMEEHYRCIQEFGPEARPGNFQTVIDLLSDENGQQTERQELVEWIYQGYLELYGIDNDWEIVAIEEPMEVDIGGGLRLAGTIDLQVRKKKLGSGIWIVDHKTCKNLPKQKDFDMEDQTGIYAHLKREAGVDIRGAIYNFCRTWKLQRDMTSDERFLRHITVRTDSELATMAEEAKETMLEAYDALERRDGEIYDRPRTPDGERCGWKCGFTEACLAGRKDGPARTRSFLSDIGFSRHDTKPGPTFNKTRPVIYREGQTPGHVDNGALKPDLAAGRGRE